jgi:hypothetical protein
MTRTKINWETQEITFYKFVCKDAVILYTYAGHTSSFRHRKTNHKSNCNNPTSKEYNYPLYQFIRANGGWDNWEMRPIKTQLCKDKMEALQIETELIDEQAFKLNDRPAYTSKEERKEQYLKYHQEHKEARNKSSLNHYYEHKEENREIHNASSIKFYHENREEINARRREKYRLIRHFK